MPICGRSASCSPVRLRPATPSAPSARRLYFYACQVPLLCFTTIAFAASGDRASRLFGLAIPIYFGLMATMHNEVHALVVSELELRERNEETNGRLREQAMRDSLTGLANRSAFVEQLERAMAAAHRDKMLIGVLYFDLDQFKFVNDSLGHSAGDELLVEVAAACSIRDAQSGSPCAPGR